MVSSCCGTGACVRAATIGWDAERRQPTADGDVPKGLIAYNKGDDAKQSGGIVSLRNRGMRTRSTTWV